MVVPSMNQPIRARIHMHTPFTGFSMASVPRHPSWTIRSRWGKEQTSKLVANLLSCLMKPLPYKTNAMGGGNWRATASAADNSAAVDRDGPGLSTQSRTSQRTTCCRDLFLGIVAIGKAE